MSDEANGNGALAVATALRDLGRQERRLIEQGRFEDLAPLAKRRAELLHALDHELTPGWPVEQAVHDVLDQARQEGAQNLTLLRAMQQDIARELNTLDQSKRAVSGYGNSSKT